MPPEDPKLIHSNDPARKTRQAILATSYFHHCLNLMARYAQLAGQTGGRRSASAALAETLKTAFNAKFYNQRKGLLRQRLADLLRAAAGVRSGAAAERPRVFAHLVKKIDRRDQGPRRHRPHRRPVAQPRAHRRRPRPTSSIASPRTPTYPSWGYMVEKGATTIWELWNGDTADPAMNSGNHVMLVGDSSSGSTNTSPASGPTRRSPGFKHIIMKPHPVGDLTFVKASHRSPYGLIASEWQRDGGTFDWQITVPPNTTATVYVPTPNAASVTESGKPVAKVSGVKFLRQEAGAAVYEVAAGSYQFHSDLPLTGK